MILSERLLDLLDLRSNSDRPKPTAYRKRGSTRKSASTAACAGASGWCSAPIAMPVVEIMNGTWEEFRAAVRHMWATTTQAANWMLEYAECTSDQFAVHGRSLAALPARQRSRLARFDLQLPALPRRILPIRAVTRAGRRTGQERTDRIEAAMPRFWRNRDGALRAATLSESATAGPSKTRKPFARAHRARTLLIIQFAALRRGGPHVRTAARNSLQGPVMISTTGMAIARAPSARASTCRSRCALPSASRFR